MAPVVTGTVDTAALRVSVQLSGVATDGPVDVYRVHTDGTRDLVRGMPAVSGGVSQVWDYLAPYTPAAGQVQFRYETTIGGTLYVSAWLELVSTQARLRAPGLPGVEATVDVLERPQVQLGRPQVVMEPIGRDTPIVQSGVRLKGRFTLAVQVDSYAQARDLERLTKLSATALLQMPSEMEPWQYVAIGDLDRSPFAGRLLPVTDGDTGSWMQYSMVCTVVDAPPGGVLGDPTASYQAIVDTGWTYQQLLDWQGTGATTYLDVIKGGF